jgi:AcrR family transcriptional regulator
MSESVGTEQQLREAAFRSLARHGYADLSIADIGEEFGRSPSLIYHYFEDKDDLLLSMLETFTEQFVDVQLEEPITDAEAELLEIVEQVLRPSADDVEPALAPPETPIDVAVARVYVELWSRATWDEQVRERVSQIDERMRETIARLVAAGVENGEFRAVDPDATAQHLLSLVQHALHVRATTGRDEVVETIRERLQNVIADLRASA